MTFKVGDKVIIIKVFLYGGFVFGRKGFITRITSYKGVMITTKEGLKEHSSNDGDFHLHFNINCIEKFSKEEQMELNFE